MHIEVFKSQKILKVFDNETEQFNYPIGIGEVALGTKKLKNDMKTPEGEYKVCVKNPKSKFFKSLGLNYPNQQDADLALQDGRINKMEHNSILKEQEEHGGSDWSTPIGGAIYIHGGLEDKVTSEGCVRMYNKDIDRLYEVINVGDTVVIYP